MGFSKSGCYLLLLVSVHDQDGVLVLFLFCTSLQLAWLAQCPLNDVNSLQLQCMYVIPQNLYFEFDKSTI